MCRNFARFLRRNRWGRLSRGARSRSDGATAAAPACKPPGARSASSRAWASAAPVAYRAAGSFSRHRAMTAASGSETSGAKSRSGGAGRETCATRTAAGAPSNGRRPLSIRNATTPNEYRSLRPSIRSPGGLFGTHILDRAEHGSRMRKRRTVIGRGCVRDAEIRQQHAPGPSLDQHIGGLHVTMHDACGVRVPEREGRLAQHRYAVACAENAAGAEAFLKREPFDVRHDEVGETLDLGGAVDRHDVRVRHAGRRPRLAYEPLARARIGTERRQHLDRDRAIQPRVVGEVHDAHSSPTELALEPVLSGQRSAKLVEHRVGRGWIRHRARGMVCTAPVGRLGRAGHENVADWRSGREGAAIWCRDDARI